MGCTSSTEGAGWPASSPERLFQKGITRQRIAEISTRENALLRFDEAQQIAKALGMDMNQLAAALGEGKEPTGGDEDSAGQMPFKPGNKKAARLLRAASF